jgi:hypothetical protein
MTPPLPSVPAHLVSDPVIQAALNSYKDLIKVETPLTLISSSLFSIHTPILSS